MTNYRRIPTPRINGEKITWCNKVVPYGTYTPSIEQKVQSLCATTGKTRWSAIRDILCPIFGVRVTKKVLIDREIRNIVEQRSFISKRPFYIEMESILDKYIPEGVNV